ncbi:tail fiber protein [uncultured Tateyamaria sp.]|uniref:phage tail protein n=1 Tax=uncultured Tateyamaria sp. TaxID=455651 RepID=UPI00261BC1EB|nr:tail fiber protein [uncultured Tateyamaria sp.]
MKKILKLTTSLVVAATAAASLSFAPQKAHAQAEPLLGQISHFGFNFCPRGWAYTNGALLPIAQNSALFSLLGTIYGGDGRTTFALPDTRGRMMFNLGSGPGLPTYQIGQRGGTFTKTLFASELPAHNHPAFAVNKNTSAGGGYADAAGPGGDTLATPDFNDPNNSNPDINIYSNLSPNVAMHPNMIGNNSTANLAFSIQNPFVTVSTCIALQGIFPSRN